MCMIQYKEGSRISTCFPSSSSFYPSCVPAQWPSSLSSGRMVSSTRMRLVRPEGQQEIKCPREAAVVVDDTGIQGCQRTEIEEQGRV